jgi:UDP-glucose 4-epimerase
MTILVTGGAGYIGSHVLKQLKQTDEEVIIIDNLSTGHRQAITYGDLHVMHLESPELELVFQNNKISSVIHFAGSIVVPESIVNPIFYYKNNTQNSLRILEFCVRYGVQHFIFSSTAATYGMPEDSTCFETTPQTPINPYGQSKLMTEKMIWDVCRSSNLRAVALRYFNVAGADPDGEIGQSFPDATHLIKVACQTALGKRSSLKVFGTDYATKDGSCIRDYIHVYDLASAHICALNYLKNGGVTDVFNCGYGSGFSVLEVIDVVKKVSGVNFKVDFVEKRAGDPAALIANSDKLKKTMQWKPKYQDLEFIVRSAYNWEKSAKY